MRRMNSNRSSDNGQRRLQILLLTLTALLLIPFGLYFALQTGADGLAAVLFALLSGAILLVMVRG